MFNEIYYCLFGKQCFPVCEVVYFLNQCKRIYCLYATEYHDNFTDFEKVFEKL